MSTILMLFILPIGILTYLWDKRNYRQSLEIFEGYILTMKRSGLTDDEKMKKIDIMFYENSYSIVQKEKMRLIVEKKHFNIGVLFIMFGLMNYIGIIVYAVYYRFFLKPRRLIADMDSDNVLQSV